MSDFLYEVKLDHAPTGEPHDPGDRRGPPMFNVSSDIPIQLGAVLEYGGQLQRFNQLQGSAWKVTEIRHTINIHGCESQTVLYVRPL